MEEKGITREALAQEMVELINALQGNKEILEMLASTDESLESGSSVDYELIRMDYENLVKLDYCSNLYERKFESLPENVKKTMGIYKKSLDLSRNHFLKVMKRDSGLEGKD